MNRGMKLQSIGMAGVYAVASRLCMLSHIVCFPSVDDGVDLMLGNGLKIQVKAGSRRMNHPGYKQGVYCIDAVRAHRFTGNTRSYVPRRYAEKVDFVVFWAIEENRFFVIPAAKVTGAMYVPSKESLLMSPRKPKQSTVDMVLGYEEAWHLLDVDAAVEGIEQMAESVEISS